MHMSFSWILDDPYDSYITQKWMQATFCYFLVDLFLRGYPSYKSYKEKYWLMTGASIRTSSAWYVWFCFKISFHWSVLISMEVYVMAETHGLRVLFMRIR